MSEFTVCRTLDTHPALRYCLLLDDVRIAGGKPDYRGDNILISWRTKETYGPVDAIKTENSQLATEKDALERRIDELCAEVERGKAEFKKMDVWHSQELKAAMDENAKLQEQTELLVTLLRNDCDIEASWDGLRKFWYIGLTESGCLMRDRACKAEAENAKLREYAAKAWSLFIAHGAVHACDLSEVDAVRDGLRELGIEVPS